MITVPYPYGYCEGTLGCHCIVGGRGVTPATWLEMGLGQNYPKCETPLTARAGQDPPGSTPARSTIGG
jgi:hypothetical protein